MTTEYKTITNTDKRLFEAEVSHHINNGYWFQGGVSVCQVNGGPAKAVMYAQAMFKMTYPLPDPIFAEMMGAKAEVEA